MVDNPDMLDDDYVFMDSESDGECRRPKPKWSPYPVKTHGSDSNLTLRNKLSNGSTSSAHKLRFKDIRLSDSKLYKRSIGRGDNDYQGSSLKFKMGEGSSQSLRDDVFKEEDMVDVKVGDINELENEYEVIKIGEKKNDSVDSGVEVNGPECIEPEPVTADECDSQVQDLTLKEQQVFYAGENGKFIVPKICVEGEEMFTTFEHIDVSEEIVQNYDSPKLDINSYQNKVVAMEIAREMAKFDKYENLETTPAVSEDVIADTFAKDLNMMNNEMNGRAPSPKMLNKSNTHSPSIETSPSSVNGAYQTTRFGQNNVPHVGACLPYDKLKSSIPDIRIAFHSEQPEVIYINDTDESTTM